MSPSQKKFFVLDLVIFFLLILGQPPERLENFSKKSQIFNFFTYSLGRVKKYPGQSWVGPLSTTDQKDTQAGLSQGPSLIYKLF